MPRYLVYCRSSFPFPPCCPSCAPRFSPGQNLRPAPRASVRLGNIPSDTPPQLFFDLFVRASPNAPSGMRGDARRALAQPGRPIWVPCPASPALHAVRRQRQCRAPRPRHFASSPESKDFPGAASSGDLVYVMPYSVKCAGLDSSLINCLSRPRASSQSGALWRPPPPAPVPLCPCPAWSGPAGSDRTLVSARILVLSSIHLGHHDSFFSGSVYHGWCKAHHEALRAGRFAP